MSRREDFPFWIPEQEESLSLSSEAQAALLEESTCDEFFLNRESEREFFSFGGIYKNKRKRLRMLQQSLLNLGFSGDTYEVRPCFLTSSLKLHEKEKEALVKSLRGKNFYFLVKFFFAKRVLRGLKAKDARAILTILQSHKAPTLMEEHEEEVCSFKTIFLGESFRLRCTAKTFASVLATINAIHYTVGNKNCLSSGPLMKSTMRARFRVAQHILHCKSIKEASKVFKVFLCRHERLFGFDEFLKNFAEI